MSKKFRANYILEGHKPIPCDDLLRFSEWMYGEDVAHRRVAETFLAVQDEDTEEVRVSTVFLGMDHAGSSRDTPQLFETKVFSGEWDGYTKRYATWEEADSGHHEVVAMLRRGCPNPQ